MRYAVLDAFPVAPTLGSLGLRVPAYGAAVEGKTNPAATWNFLAAAAATALGIELKSGLATASGAAWMASQLEAWVDEPVPVAEKIDWKIPVGALLILVAGYRAWKAPKPWLWA